MKWDVVGVVTYMVALLVLTVVAGWTVGAAAAGLTRCDCPTPACFDQDGG